MLKILLHFIESTRKDGRIHCTHISIYLVLWSRFMKQNGINPIRLFSYEGMQAAKISTRATYCKRIKELSMYGYIRYIPSFNKNRPSVIFINEVQ